MKFSSTLFSCLYPIKVQTRCYGHTPQLSALIQRVIQRDFEVAAIQAAQRVGGFQFSQAVWRGRKEGNVLFNDALNTFYLRLYGVMHMVKDHSDFEGGNSLPPHGLLFPISSKGSFICIIPQTG